MVPYMLGVKETNVGIMTSQISGKLLAALTTVGTAEEDYGREVPRMGNTILQPRHQTITGSEVRRVLQPLGHGSLLDGGVRYRAESRNAGAITHAIEPVNPNGLAIHQPRRGISANVPLS